ncbi:tRNA cyclic N6-threonylcarbamoyladenosine(37) synthase TcdA [Planctobacterium marinum]|uniref:tRNA cyclic N6-threonylcarbamoyladenosine(37) synthase TcdA n=1 Tax=Planctobacterium marinum TaxID=1631968 RepID=UPI001E2E6E08|nr:tRNA cyclic N6-threonylcarbamoyladenosine(37) synthase TcdA [Planctobacterium marinum]MCC2607544.1 tRNA cyclic N6-threonylcarbamoyladenosine(37) synthase TcdA [Planctobacterium marinum]
MDLFSQRFGGIERLYGQQQLAFLRQAHVCVVGIGGVGSWTAEALARSGIGKLTLIDLDDICVTNTNRQIHALSTTVGQNKVDVMAQRIKLINPDCEVQAVMDFVTDKNVTEHLKDFAYVVDATDSVKAKAAMINHCKRQKMPIITVGGAGGQVDPTQITVGDLAKTKQDPLAAKLRAFLRRYYGFSQNPKRRFSVECVYSTEQLRYPDAQGNVSYAKQMTGGVKLDCSGGFGAAVTVTATFGLITASRVLNKLIEKHFPLVK